MMIVATGDDFYKIFVEVNKTINDNNERHIFTFSVAILAKTSTRVLEIRRLRTVTVIAIEDFTFGRTKY